MGNINPVLIFIWEVRRALERGQSLSYAIKKYLQHTKKKDIQNQFQYQIETWWLAKNEAKQVFNFSSLTNFERELLHIIDMGLAGESIQVQLSELEKELILSCEAEIERFTALLPIKMLVPLLVLIFPSLLMLLVFPLLSWLQF